MDFMTGVFIAEEVYAGEEVPKARLIALLHKLHINRLHQLLPLSLARSQPHGKLNTHQWLFLAEIHKNAFQFLSDELVLG